jgi:hypothetical protein
MTAVDHDHRLAAPIREGRRGAGVVRDHRLSRAERHGALLAGTSLLTLTALSVVAGVALEWAGHDGIRGLVGVTFIGVAALDVVAAWGLYLVVRDRAGTVAYAALISRLGYAVLLTVAATALIWPGGDAVADFRSDWRKALVVLGLHLIVASLALWRSRIAPRIVAVVTFATGVAYLVDDVATRFAATGGHEALLPLVLGDLLLVGWLLLASREWLPRDRAAAAMPADIPRAERA